MLKLSINKLSFFFTKEEVFLQKNNVAWKGPCAVIVDADGQQILVKHGSFHVRKHSYNAHLGTESEASCSSKSSENVINV